MSAQPEWLIDKSAVARISSSVDSEVWMDRVQRGLVRIIAPTVLEIGYAARSESDWHALVEAPPITLMPLESITPQIERRALSVQGILAGRGEHRALSVPDLLIAATAELAGLIVLHVDKDFEIIADVTGQAVERLRIA